MYIICVCVLYQIYAYPYHFTITITITVILENEVFELHAYVVGYLVHIISSSWRTHTYIDEPIFALKYLKPMGHITLIPGR